MRASGIWPRRPRNQQFAGDILIADEAPSSTWGGEIGHRADANTDMLAGIDAPKTAAAEVASRLLDGLAADQEDIFPDPNAEAMAQLWRSDPKGLERALAGAAAA